MKRDMDLIRKILFLFETNAGARLDSKSIVFEEHSSEQIKFHIELMKDAGLIDHHIIQTGGRDGVPFLAKLDAGMRLTMSGYDLLDSVRDSEIWKKTKDGAHKAGGFSIDLIKALAKGFLKTQIEKQTGIKLEN